MDIEEYTEKRDQLLASLEDDLANIRFYEEKLQNARSSWRANEQRINDLDERWENDQ